MPANLKNHKRNRQCKKISYGKQAWLLILGQESTDIHLEVATEHSVHGNSEIKAYIEAVVNIKQNQRVQHNNLTVRLEFEVSHMFQNR